LIGPLPVSRTIFTHPALLVSYISSV